MTTARRAAAIALSALMLGGLPACGEKDVKEGAKDAERETKQGAKELKRDVEKAKKDVDGK